MAYVEPIKNKEHLKYAAKYLQKNHDPAFSLIWNIGLETGLRISDILRLKYSDIDFRSGHCEVIESKGTLARKARAKHRVLKQVKEELILHYQHNVKKLTATYITPFYQIEKLLPKEWKLMVNERVSAAKKATPPVTRSFLFSKKMVFMLKQRKEKFRHINSDSVFSRKTLLSNRAKGVDGLLTRQACWTVFSKLTQVLEKIGSTAKVGCHTLRKSFARHLYFATGKDISLVMTTIGHKSESVSLRYIGVSDDDIKLAQKTLITYLSS
ncbi:tyrosine-type recombinase/integrase [Aliivibrio fischeri]|uniref:tyrosine-type recombinase/integrase n=1 Tax=Aliivibrio fischeri TaxID=668 RepID=UPI0007C492B1|nr:tyrosine-type recombinase/integrase [Aliivibrio fischeri]MUK40258.1 tyrosine-type recombinase/integrase [Aliivibrio fischeri]